MFLGEGVVAEVCGGNSDAGFPMYASCTFSLPRHRQQVLRGLDTKSVEKTKVHGTTAGQWWSTTWGG